MTTIRLLLAQVEGTLLTSGDALTIATQEAVDSLRDASIELAITSRLLLGSVADRVIRTAPCPVLTVRKPE
jgi:nucleotide-binding universal stress UspA family protein